MFKMYYHNGCGPCARNITLDIPRKISTLQRSLGNLCDITDLPPPSHYRR